MRDELRPEAAEVVAQLRRDGYHVAMLTGDNQLTAEALARKSRNHGRARRAAAGGQSAS